MISSQIPIPCGTNTGPFVKLRRLIFCPYPLHRQNANHTSRCACQHVLCLAWVSCYSEASHLLKVSFPCMHPMLTPTHWREIATGCYCCRTNEPFVKKEAFKTKWDTWDRYGAGFFFKAMLFSLMNIRMPHCRWLFKLKGKPVYGPGWPTLLIRALGKAARAEPSAVVIVKRDRTTDGRKTGSGSFPSVQCARTWLRQIASDKSLIRRRTGL